MRVEVESVITRTPRVAQLEGIFDLPPSERSGVSWDADLPIDERDWHVGLIVGPSGSGKTTVARALWPDQLTTRHDWPRDRSVVDGFPTDLGVREIVELLSSVGFSSPPAWLRPYDVLSNGEQFRVSIARALAERAPITVIDEFTSVVDRTVAQLGAHAIAKTVRRRDQRFVAVTCHYDVADWLQPDWTYEPAVGIFTWGSDHPGRPRPTITLTIRRTTHELWRVFRHHHYLSAELNKAAHCYVATLDDEPCAFVALLPFPHSKISNGWRVSRRVVLPDYQGVGLGDALVSHVAGCYRAAGRRVFTTTAHPANIRGMARSPRWKMTRPPGLAPAPSKSERAKGVRRSNDRITASFEYVGPAIDSALSAQLVMHFLPTPRTRQPKRP